MNHFRDKNHDNRNLEIEMHEKEREELKELNRILDFKIGTETGILLYFVILMCRYDPTMIIDLVYVIIISFLLCLVVGILPLRDLPSSISIIIRIIATTAMLCMISSLIVRYIN